MNEKFRCVFKMVIVICIFLLCVGCADENREERGKKSNITTPTKGEEKQVSPTPYMDPTGLVTPMPSDTPTPMPTDTPTPKPTDTPTPLPTDTPTPLPTDTPVPTPTVSLEYTTNSESEAKDGNKGQYAYMYNGRNYKQYIIIDFDEGYVYFFNVGDGSFTYDRSKLTSGDLNSYVLVTWKDGSDSWENALHFEYKNQPDRLIFEDSLGASVGDYRPTNLKKAFDIMNGLKMQDFTGEPKPTEAPPMPTPTPVTETIDVKPGEHIHLGCYEQDKNIPGKEEIDWVVLEVNDGKALVISSFVLDAQAYNESSSETTWDTCSLRKWLNNSFFTESFSDGEQNSIIIAKEAVGSSQSAGAGLDDKIFIFSTDEAKSYFTSSESRRCSATSYAISRGVYVTDSFKTQDGRVTCAWLLRSNKSTKNVSCVVCVGDLYEDGFEANDKTHAIRPAIWVDLVKLAEHKSDTSITPTPTVTPTPKPTLQTLKPGDYYSFGSYEQDNNTSNGKEKIEWLVLEVKDGKALLISKYALDCIPFNFGRSNVTWETCSLRKWLNDSFYNNAFDSKEKKRIQKTSVSADENSKYKDTVTSGKTTKDYVFLLSLVEANKYFPEDKQNLAMCAVTDYAKAKGCLISSDINEEGRGTCLWWLRTPGSSQDTATTASTHGSFYVGGRMVQQDNVGVRPVIWIDTK